MKVLIALGQGYAQTDMLELAAGAVDTLFLTGGRLARVDVEVVTDDGSGTSDGEPTYRKIFAMRGVDPASCVAQLTGPLFYRVVRQVEAAASGCNLLGANQETGVSPAPT